MLSETLPQGRRQLLLGSSQGREGSAEDEHNPRVPAHTTTVKDVITNPL